MKSKFLFLSAILFFVLGKHYHDELIFYFFSLQMLLLFIAVFFHKREKRMIARYRAQVQTPDDAPKS